MQTRCSIRTIKEDLTPRVKEIERMANPRKTSPRHKHRKVARN
jgi:hypothetical protein